MSSSFGFLAYAFASREPDAVTQMRISHSRGFMSSVHADPLVETKVGDGLSGMVGWHGSNRSIDWEVHATRNGAMTTWLHVPSAAGGPESGADSWDLASDLFEKRVAVEDLGAPFAVARWDSGTMQIANDILGLVRLFHYRFDGLEVWTTRQGIAHVFAGVAPHRNSLAWAGMATLGWAPGGATHLGEGRQMLGGTRILCRREHESTRVTSSEHLATWLEQVRSEIPPSAAAVVADMGRHMSTAKRWRRGVIADLSGGKDSRVGAAVGLRSGSIAGLRTVDTDPGEVRVAQHLMSAIDVDIPHVIETRRPPRAADGSSRSFKDRLLSNHHAFEGRYLPHTAFGSKGFDGFLASTRPRFNGLGGEVLAGGNFQGDRWAALSGAPLEKAKDRLEGMVRLGVASSNHAKEEMVDFSGTFLQRAERLGASTAGEALDVFYALDKMPNWSIIFASDSAICPLFSRSAVAAGVHAMGAPAEPGVAHRKLIRRAIPEWGDVEFYKPAFKTRSTPPVWHSEEWDDIRQYVDDRGEAMTMYSVDAIRHLLKDVSNGTGGRPQETAILNILWDLTFDLYLESVSRAAGYVRAEKRRMGS